MEFIEEIGFDHSYSFIYSARPGTPAADLPDDVPMEALVDKDFNEWLKNSQER